MLSGEQSGKVGVWDVGTGRMFRQLYNVKAPVNGIFIQVPGELEEIAKTSVPVIPRPRYEAVLAAAGTTFDPSKYAVNVSLIGTLDEEDDGDEELSGREWESSFGKETDLEWIEKGAREMMGAGGKVEGRKKVQQLEEELERMYEAYERLSEVQKKTWGELVNQAASKGRS